VSQRNEAHDPHVVANLGFVGFLAMYALSLVLCIGFAFLAKRYLGFTFVRAIAAPVAVLYLAAAVTYPGRLYAMLRYLGWFSLIRDDRLVRLILGVIGLVLLVVASFGGRAT
jgi:hypothetical protein